MNKLQQIFVSYGREYIKQFSGSIPANHIKVINAICNCRTGNLGTVSYRCDDCNRQIKTGRSCGNRFCPVCQYSKTQEWINTRLNESLPGHHFMITFTVPEELRSIMRSNQLAGYKALFKASSETIKAFVKDKKVAGGEKAAFWGILHTGGRTPNYHPHIHYVVAGGALSKDKKKWTRTGETFFANVRAMSKRFKGHLKSLMVGAIEDIPEGCWEKTFNVNCQAVGNSENSIKYLSSYVFRAGISANRIISTTDGKVTFKYKKNKSNRSRLMTITAEEFIRRYLQQVLPSGFMRIRYYGCLNAASKMNKEELLAMIELSYGFEVERRPQEEMAIKKLKCKHCGGALRYLFSNLHRSDDLTCRPKDDLPMTG